MTISNILAIQNLMPGAEPDFFVTGREPKRQPYKFRDNDDLVAAQAEANLILEDLREKYDDDEAAVLEEFHEIVEASERLRRAVNQFAIDEYRKDPRFEKLVAKEQRAAKKRGAAKR